MNRFRIIALLPLAAMLSACDAVVLNPSGDIAVQQRDIVVISTALMLLVIVPVMVLTVLFAWRYRQSNTAARYEPDWNHSMQLELVIWGGPLLIVACLGALTWMATHLLDPYRPIGRVAAGQQVAQEVRPLEVDVVSLDWKWLFIYPDQRVATVNALTVPVGAPLQFELTSSSVMNVFFIPQLGSMIYTMNGMVTHLNLRADQEGDLQGLSAHFSGDGFPAMLFDVHVISALDFPNWVATTAKSNNVLSADAYKQLAQQSIETGRPTYRLDDPTLFRQISTQQIPPGPGPQLTDNIAKPASGAANVR